MYIYTHTHTHIHMVCINWNQNTRVGLEIEVFVNILTKIRSFGTSTSGMIHPLNKLAKMHLWRRGSPHKLPYCTTATQCNAMQCNHI